MCLPKMCLYQLKLGQYQRIQTQSGTVPQKVELFQIFRTKSGNVLSFQDHVLKNSSSSTKKKERVLKAGHGYLVDTEN